MLSNRLFALTGFAFIPFAAAGGLRGQSSAPDVLVALKGHTDTVEAVAISPDGRLIATASFDRNVRLFETGTGKEIRTTAANRATRTSAVGRLQREGDQIATGGSDNFARVWDVPDGFPAARFAAMTTAAGPVAALHHVGEHLPPRERLAHRMKFSPATPLKSFQHPNLVDCVAFDDTGTLLATGCHDGILRVWDIAKGTATKTINAHIQTTPMQVQNPIYAVMWSPDYKQIFSSSYDKTIKLWDATSGNLVREFKAAPDPKPIAPKKEEPKKEDAKKDDKKDDKKDPPKKPSVPASAFLGGLVADDPPLPPGPPGHRDQVFTMALTKDGKFLATGSSDRTIKLWEVATGRVAREFPNPDLKPVLPGEVAPSHPGWIQSVRLPPDGPFLVSAGPAPRGKSYVAVWKVSDGKRVHGAERDFGPIHSIAITPDGAKLVIGCAPLRGKQDAEAFIVRLPGK